MDNMNNAELYGRVLRVNLAQPMKIKGGEKGFSHQPVWADADSWLERQQQEEEASRLRVEEKEQAAADSARAKNAMEQAEEEVEAAGEA